MVEKDQQGVPMAALLKIGGMVKARVLACQHEMEQRIARTITFVQRSLPSSGLSSGTKPTDQYNFQADQFVLVNFAFPPSNDELTSLLERAADSGCAALVLHSDSDILFSSSWIQQAEILGMPVLYLPTDVSPAELISPLMDELIRREQALLNRITSIQERMVSQILTGGGGQGIVDLLFTFMGRPVMLVDESGTILGQAGTWHQIPDADILSNPDQLSSTLASLAGHTGQWYDLNGILGLKTFGQEHLVARPVMAGNDVLGWFILNSGPESMDISTRLALDQAAIAAALEIGRQAAIRQVEYRLQANFLDDLFGQKKSIGTLGERAKRLRWDLKHKRSVMLVSWEEQEIGTRLRRQLEASVSRFICAWRPESLVLPRESEIVILPHLPEASDLAVAMETLQTLSQGLLKEWPIYFKNIPLVVAIGGVQPSLKEIVVSYREAQRALAMRRRLGLRYPVVTFQEVRIFSLLERHLEDEEAIALFKRTIGPLAEYDAKHQTEFVRTAEVYFDCNCRLQQAADQLLIHPSSLKYRLQRIRDILGNDPFFDKGHLDYYLATKIARLL